MRDDSVVEATAARKAYEARPWLKHYPSFIQPEITPRFANGLEMLLATVQTMPEQPAMYYFDRAISYSELDRTSSALAFAFKTRGIRIWRSYSIILTEHPPIFDWNVCGMESWGYRGAMQPHVQAA